jgi:hypothetical protein
VLVAIRVKSLKGNLASLLLLLPAVCVYFGFGFPALRLVILAAVAPVLIGGDEWV